MSTEKISSLYEPSTSFEEKTSKDKYCKKNVITWILAALLVALIVAQCFQFLFPFTRYTNEINVVHVFNETAVEVPFIPATEKTVIGKGRNEIIHEPWHLDFVINPTGLCDTLNPPESNLYMRDAEVQLLMLVSSAISHFAQRSAIRKTWGSVAEKPKGRVRLGFVLGTTFNLTEQDMVRKESESYGDIIQADFEDTNNNMTTKSVLMLKWVSKHCPHARYILKANDDTFVNLEILIKLLTREPFNEQDKFIGGYIRNGVQPSRGPGENNYVSEFDYPNDRYPPYASGSAYVTTGPTASQLFEAARQVRPFLPMDDVFITGLCADQIDATLIHEPGFQLQEFPIHPPWDSYNSFTTVHSVSPENMGFLWNEINKSIFDALHFAGNFFSPQISIDGSSYSDALSLEDSETPGNPFIIVGNTEILDEMRSPGMDFDYLDWGEIKANVDETKTQTTADALNNWQGSTKISLAQKDSAVGNSFLRRLFPVPINMQTVPVFNMTFRILK